MFDVYIAVDWSARSVPTPKKPSKDGIWVAEKVGEGSSRESYFRTRHACKKFLKERIQLHRKLDRRVLIGFDYPYGYPKGFLDALGLDSWKHLWSLLDDYIEDNKNNANNRFKVASQLNAKCGEQPGPFWGHPVGREYNNLNMKSPEYPYQVENIALSRLRLVEQQSTGTQPTWKLIGAGSVGSQALVGIPVVKELYDTFEDSTVWPFETGFTSPQPAIVHCEIFPSLFPIKGGLIKDRAQVRSVVEWMATSNLQKHFSAPKNLSPQQIKTCTQVEGWILGV